MFLILLYIMLDITTTFFMQPTSFSSDLNECIQVFQLRSDLVAILLFVVTVKCSV